MERKLLSKLCYPALAILLTPGILTAEESHSSTIAEAFTNGSSKINFRYRYETVEQENMDDDAAASTLKSRLTYNTDTFNNFSLLLEFDDVHHLGEDDYNSGAGTSPNKTNFPVIADPTGSEVNQAYIKYKNANNMVKIGRQRILLNNQRFVGGVGFRQNEQTYDGISYTGKFDNMKFFYAYIDRVNRIFGDKVAAGNHNQETHLGNMDIKLGNAGKLTTYFLGIDNDDAAAFSTYTTGIRFAGKQKFSDFKAHYAVEFARQSDYRNNPVDYRARYWHAEAGLGKKPLTISLGFESLGGDENKAGAAFRTPLATLHKFNGWADKFLATPDAGLEDRYIKFHGMINGVKWLARFHDFESDEGSMDFGQEFNFHMGKQFTKNYGVGLTFASYNGDEETGIPDTDKVWVTFTAKF